MVEKQNEPLKDPEVLEVIEHLLEMCMEREEQIAKLNLKIEKLNKNIKSDKSDSRKTNSDEKSPKRNSDGKAILVAMGSDYLQRQMSSLLKSNGYEIVGTAHDGQEAIRLSADTKPDLIVLDSDLPIVDGIQAASHIKQNEPTVKIVILSFNRNKDAILRAIRFGADDYIAKPIQPERLLQVINNLIAS
ncbi:response regulator [bacterium]|nr:response regulator [bacterium]